MPRSSLLSALRIALTYLVVAALWIVLSDRAVEWLFADPHQQNLMQTWKGWFFVAVTAGLLFCLIRSALRRLEREILEQQRLASRLEANNEVQRHLLAALDNIVWLFDLTQQKMLFISVAAERIYGLPCQSFIDDNSLWLRSIHPEDVVLAETKQQLMQSQGWGEVEYRIVRPDGQQRWIRDRTQMLFDAAGNAVSLIGIATDITDQRQHAEHIHRLSNYDNLTGLPNRMMLEGLMYSALTAARRDGKR
ncbi:MAG TPA: PAS domain-containing protein, partial [Rhodocyclaceae bacterium]|nr:PAS domain-containing protein [Rhodocyclaceae bacterium]